MREMTEYPNDADGEALRRIAGDGSDMSRAMNIDFVVAVGSEAAAHAVAKRAAEAEFLTSVRQDEESRQWVCYCTKTMIPTYDGVVTTQAELDRLAAPYGGCSDGWGTFGNVEE
jgi:hypothetical protein